MCGIAGFIDTERDSDADALHALATAMAQALRHRGPDDAGEWADPASGVALGFRRLAIIDLTETGKQPMVSASGRYVLVFNGEVYNHRELRRDLEGRGARFRGTSDTEVLLAVIDANGIEPALRRANGMFGLAVWDRERRVLTLARDRFGEKPLFYGWMGSTFVFGSEMKALWQHPDFRFEVDRDSAALYMRYGYVPAPRSILRHVAKVEPGSFVEVDPDRPGEIAGRGTYWSLLEAAQHAAASPVDMTAADAVDTMDELLRASVARRMIADVPLGAFLSGGIDSSAIVALMQAEASSPVRTFTIGFAESGFNEAEHAARVAAHIGTKHTELYLTAADAMDVVPSLPAMFDEPFADSSQIPTHLVARLARRDVTVALSGDGGDEVFAGYNRHVYRRTLDRMHVPHVLRRAAGSTIRAVSPDGWDRLAARMSPLLPPRFRRSRVGDRLHKIARVLPLDDTQSILRLAVSMWPQPEQLVVGATEPATLLTAHRDWGSLTDPTLQMVYLDSMTYLPDDILTKVDRATMAVSLEARVPYLDPDVVEFSWRLPLDWRIRRGRGKWLLRRVLDRYVPEELVLRPKSGFEVPIGRWLRGDLREWAETLISAQRLTGDGILDGNLVRSTWQEHLAGRRDRKEALWAVLMFQAWHESASSAVARRLRPGSHPTGG